MTNSDGLDRLATLAAKARRDLTSATGRRAVPEPRVARRPSRRRRTSFGMSVLASVGAACLVLGVVLGAGVLRDRVLLPSGQVSSVPGGDQPSAVATDGRVVWVADRANGRIEAFDGQTLAPRWSVRAGQRPIAIAYGLGALWVVDAGDLRLRKLSPLDGRALGESNTSLEPVAVTTAAGRVWVLSAANATLDGYDPQSLVQDRAAIIGMAGSDVSTAGGVLWVATPGRLQRVTPDSVVSGFVLPAKPVLVAATDRYTWVTTADNRLLAVDPSTGAVLGSSALPSSPTALAANADGAYIACDDGTVVRVTAPDLAAVVVARPGSPLAALVMTSKALVGTSTSAGLLYYLMELTS